jgi:hypothetical protein
MPSKSVGEYTPIPIAASGCRKRIRSAETPKAVTVQGAAAAIFAADTILQLSRQLGG